MDTTHKMPHELQETEASLERYPNVVRVSEEARMILEDYSGLDPDEVLPHVEDLRKRAFAVWPYPCIGNLRFLDLTAATHPNYGEIIERLKSGQTYLDAGCCLGQDLRKLMCDGAPSSSALSGMDVQDSFFSLGFDLFRDREKMNATFMAADLTKKILPNVAPVLQRTDIVSAQSLFHLFNLQDQMTIAQHLVSFTRPGPGAIIVGRQAGDLDSGEKRGVTKAKVFLHDLNTFKQFWHDVGVATNTKWEVEAQVEKAPEMLNHAWSTPNIMVLVFKVSKQ